MAGGKARGVLAGLALIALGLGLYFFRDLEGVAQSALFFVIGGVFLAAYFSGRSAGFLIPGCILLGLATGIVVSEVGPTEIESMPFGLGCGFVAIFLIPLLYERQTHWWPLIPGGILLATSISHTKSLLELALDNWPLFLVGAGLILVIRAMVGSGAK